LCPTLSVTLTDHGECLVFTRYGKQDGAEGTEIARYEVGPWLMRIFPREGADVGATQAFARVREIQIDTSVWQWDQSDPVVTTNKDDLALGGLPKGLGVMFQYGLGLPKRHRRLIREVEANTECSVIHLGAEEELGVSGDVLRLGVTRFGKFIHAVDLHQGRGSVVVGRLNDAEAFNFVAEAVGRPSRPPSPGRLPLIKAMTRVVSGETELDESGRAEPLNLVAAESRAAAAENPEAFGQLRHDLDIVTLEVLINQFEAALAGPSASKEDTWQTFFRRNVFALQQLFAAPIALVDEQVQVRIPSLGGTGAQLPDFLLLNTVSRNVHLVEIKTPKTPLLKSKHRGRGGAMVFPPHGKLSGAVAQLQAQVQSAVTDLPLILARTADAPDLDVVVVRGAVIAGSVGHLTAAERESFMRYRAGLFGVEVVTFDEVLDRLKGLQEMLNAGEKSTACQD